MQGMILADLQTTCNARWDSQNSCVCEYCRNESGRFANCETCDKVRGIVYACEYCSK